MINHPLCHENTGKCRLGRLKLYFALKLEGSAAFLRGRSLSVTSGHFRSVLMLFCKAAKISGEKQITPRIQISQVTGNETVETRPSVWGSRRFITQGKGFGLLPLWCRHVHFECRRGVAGTVIRVKTASPRKAPSVPHARTAPSLPTLSRPYRLVRSAVLIHILSLSRAVSCS